MEQTVPSGFIDYKKVIEAVFNPNPQLPCTELYKGGSTKVYWVDTPELLVVRIASGDKDYYEFQAELLEAIADDDNITARVLHWEMREIDNQICGIQIQTYLPGAPLDHYPHPVESRAIVKATYALHERLCSYFLVSSLLYASDNSRTFDLNEVIGYWPEPLNQQDVLLMMQVFPIMLGLHKAYQFAHDPSVDPAAYQSNMKLLMKCLQVIWEWRDSSGTT